MPQIIRIAQQYSDKGAVSGARIFIFLWAVCWSPIVRGQDPLVPLESEKSKAQLASSFDEGEFHKELQNEADRFYLKYSSKIPAEERSVVKSLIDESLVQWRGLGIAKDFLKSLVSQSKLGLKVFGFSEIITTFIIPPVTAGLFAMLDLRFKAWDPVETYRRRYWTQIMIF